MHEETGNAEDEKEDVIHQLELAQNLQCVYVFAFTFLEKSSNKKCSVFSFYLRKRLVEGPHIAHDTY